MSIDSEKNIIQVSDVSFGFGHNNVLDNISFTIKKGSYVGIIGPNGGGKTTLLKLLLGLIKPQHGTIKIFGVDIDSFKNKFEIGYVPQRASQENYNFPATVYEIVASGITPTKKILQPFTQEDIKAINKAMEIAQVTKLKDKLISNLSGGERQRVYVSRALVANPKILLLDEPFVGVDIASQADFYHFLKELNEKHGLTILFVSHDVDVISREAKEILCLNRRLVCQGNPRDILGQNLIETLYGKKIIHIHHDQ